MQSIQPVEQLLHFSCIILSWAWWSYQSSEVTEMHASVSSPVSKRVLKHVWRTTQSSFSKRQLYVTTYSTFPVLFSHGHCGVICPPKKVQRYDDDDAPEVQSTQPIVHAEVHASVSPV